VGGSKNSIEAVHMGRVYFTKAAARNNAMTALRLWQTTAFFIWTGQTAVSERQGLWTLAEAAASIIADSGFYVLQQ
jgi:hypothetical protein